MDSGSGPRPYCEYAANANLPGIFLYYAYKDKIGFSSLAGFDVTDCTPRKIGGSYTNPTNSSVYGVYCK